MGEWALGLMSGTSLDGIDAALIQTDGHRVHKFGPWLTVPYEEKEKEQLRAAVRQQGDMVKLEQELTIKHAVAVKMLLAKAKLKPSEVRVVGFHGQTVDHRPEDGVTWQLGDGPLLAKLTGIDVVCDFRRRDVAAGGQGAPLVPLFHAALVHGLDMPMAVLNIGGIANVTWVGPGEDNLLAFDTGPGNAMLNDWVHQHTGADYDADGRLSLAGKVQQDVVAALLKNPFFKRKPPKSLDRNHFSLEALEGLSVEDGAATLADFVGACVFKGIESMPKLPKRWLICGGGRHNPAVLRGLKARLQQVEMVDAMGWHGDALEAQAFAFLAVRSLEGMPISLPSTTGVSKPMRGGTFYRAAAER